MMEIKFRIYREKKQDMIHFDLNGLAQEYHKVFEKGKFITGIGGGSFIHDAIKAELPIMRYIGLIDKNGVEIYEGDIVGRKGVYHFIEREGWKVEQGNWKIIGEKTKNFTGEKEEKYIAGYQLYPVRWDILSCGFEPFSDSSENCGCCGGGFNPSNYEVVGNIHEHPDLLKQG